MMRRTEVQIAALALAVAAGTVVWDTGVTVWLVRHHRAALAGICAMLATVAVRSLVKTIRSARAFHRHQQEVRDEISAWRGSSDGE
jgi:hypothetical protein